MKLGSAVLAVSVLAVSVSAQTQAPLPQVPSARPQTPAPPARISPQAPSVRPQSPAPVPRPRTPAPASQADPAGQRTIRFLCDFDSPPFHFLEGVEKKGFEVELGEALGKALGAKTEWVKKDFNPDVYIGDLRTKRADAVLSSMSITEDRERVFAFTRPYYRSGLAVATHEKLEDEMRDKTKIEVRGPVGVVRNTTGEEFAKEELNVNMKRYPNADELAKALSHGREVACIVHDEAILNYLLEGDTDAVIIAQNVEPQYYGIAVTKSDKKLLEELNAALEKLDEDGTYAALYEKWFKRRRGLPAQRQ